jgi:glycosyltransferase involved in cell wall biosynthesis
MSTGSRSIAETDTPPVVSVIVPHYEDLARLALCLDRLQQQTWRADRLEVIVADNMSPSGITAVEAVTAGRAKLVIATERGAGPARNRGVAAATGSILAFTDADCLPALDWIEQGVAALACTDLIGGRMTVVAGQGRPMSAAEAFETVFAFDNRRYVQELHFTVTANLFCPRTFFDRIGPFRVGVSEDLEWSHRARAAGLRLGYCDAAVVAHPARETWDDLLRKWTRINRETYALSPPTIGHRLGFLARAWLMPLSIFAHAPRIWRSKALRSSRDRLVALKGLAGLRLWRMIDSHRVVLGRQA